jgi:antirestriction protein ArdC
MFNAPGIAKMAKEKRDVAQEITDKFIAAIEGGMSNGKWERPWNLMGGNLPTNILTGKVYSGINFLLLAAMGGGMWGTYNQWQEVGAQVRKGEKSMTIIRPLFGKDKQTDESKLFGWAGAAVFNASQVDGYEAPTVEASKPFAVNQIAEAVIASTGASITHGGDKAFYMPSMDRIQMPAREAFHSEADYYSTLMHELVHWTGHTDRLDRGLNTSRFGTDAYAFEELVAELGSCFLAAHTGVHIGFNDNHAQYLAGWLRIMKGDKNAIMSAASKAQAATDLILNGKAVDTVEDTAEAA